ncbi:MAG TPA: gamma-glutamyltransferase [Egibacteraceae bacterium]|nr:gamma-glutamyltransferase [Egibacteraceae bacterium]
MSTVPAGAAAHHPDTLAAAVEVLSDGGTAADAAVAATLASCVAETTMTGLAGGGHAIHFDAARGAVDLLDFFVAVPGLDGRRHDGDPVVVDMLFEDEAVPYIIGPASVGVPGVVAGCGALSERFGRLPWARLVEPALRLARNDCVLPPTHARVLEMLAPALTLSDGADIYAPGGRLLQGGELLRQPGLVAAFEVLHEEGAAGFYTGTLGAALAALMAEQDGPLGAADLQAYRVVDTPAHRVDHAGATVIGRRDLAGALETLGGLTDLHGADDATRAVTIARALHGPDRHGDTTNVTVVDRDGNACVVTTSLGLGSGDWVPGFGIHLNSMLGERDLRSGPLVPGGRLGSMMCPTVAVNGDGLVAAAGAAGGSRIRSALVQVLSGLLAEGVDATTAVSRPRLHRDGPLVHVEPDYPPAGVEALRAAGFVTRVWRTRHHFFGGVGVVARSGACGEPRRDGAAAVL